MMNDEQDMQRMNTYTCCEYECWHPKPNPMHKKKQNSVHTVVDQLMIFKNIINSSTTVNILLSTLKNQVG